jgi:hypothetical protein
LAILFPGQRQACGPEARALRAKSIGRLSFGFRIADFGFRGFLFQSAFRNQQSAIAEARPAQEAKGASWFLRATPLLPGLALPEIQSIVSLLRKSEGGQELRKMKMPSPHRAKTKPLKQGSG